MKKNILLSICMLLCFNTFAQTDWGESIDWKKGFYIYAAGTNLELTENQEIFLIYNYFYDDWKQFHNDEFEWKDRKAQNLRIINEEIESNKNYRDRNYYIVTSKEFGTYDFEKQGYPVTISSGAYFSFDQPFKYDEFVHYNSVPKIALWLTDFSKYNFFPMEEKEARTFQANRKDRYGNIDREIMLVIHYKIEDFSSTSYKNIKSQFSDTGYQPIVGNITFIEVFDTEGNKLGELIQS